MRKVMLCACVFSIACAVGACAGLQVKATYQYPAPVVAK